jgi:hypothetical protein
MPSAPARGSLYHALSILPRSPVTTHRWPSDRQAHDGGS